MLIDVGGLNPLWVVLSLYWWAWLPKKEVTEYEPKISQVAVSLHALCFRTHGQVLLLNPFPTFLP